MNDRTPKGDADRGRLRRRLRPLGWLWSTLKWTALSVLLIIGLALLYLQTDHGKETVRTIVVDVLDDVFAGRIEVDRIDGTIVSRVELHGVRVFDPEDRLTLSVGVLTADVHPLGFLAQTVHLSGITVDGVDMGLMDAEGAVAIARAFQPRVPSAPEPEPELEDDDGSGDWIVRLEDIAVSDGLFNDFLGYGEDGLELSALTIDVSMTVNGSALRWDDVDIRAETNVPTFSPLSVRGDIALAGDSLSVSHLAIDAGPHRLRGSGRVDLDTVDPLELRLSALDVDMSALPEAWLPRLVRGQAEMKGSVTLLDGVLAISLQSRSAAALLEVQGGANLNASPFTYQGEVWVREAHPYVVLPELPTDFVTDLEFVFSGHGDPMDGHPFQGRVSLQERAPGNDGRLEIALRIPDGAGRVGEDGPMFLFDLNGESLGLAPWRGLLGVQEVSARVDTITGDGSVRLPPAGPPQVTGRFELHGAADGYVPGMPSPARVGEFSLRTDLQWGGGLPTGTLTLSLTDGVQDTRSVESADVDLTLTPMSAGRSRVRGFAAVHGYRDGSETQIERLKVPVNLIVSESSLLPWGYIRVEADGAKLMGRSVSSLRGRFDVTPRGPRAIHILGVFKALGLALGPELRAKDLSGDVDMEVGFGGSVVGDIDAVASGGRFGAMTAKRLDVEAHIDAPEGIDSGAALSGTFDLSEVAPSADLVIVESAGEFSASYVDGIPTGTIELKETELDAGSRHFSIPKIEATLGKSGLATYSVKALDGVLSATLDGTLQLPLAGHTDTEGVITKLLVSHRPVTATGALGDPETLVEVTDVRWDKDTGLYLGDWHLNGDRGRTGGVRLAGYVDPHQGELAISLDIPATRLRDWLPTVAIIMGVEIGSLPDVDGGFALQLKAQGRLDAPTITLDTVLSEARYETLRGLNLVVGLSYAPRSGLVADPGDITLSWGKTGGITTDELQMPIHLSLWPFDLSLEPDTPAAIEVSAREENLAYLQAMAASFGQQELVEEIGRIDGALTAKISLNGAFQRPGPTVRWEADIRRLTYGGLRDGRLAMRGQSGDGKTSGAWVMDGADKQILQIEARVPVDLYGLATEPNTESYVRHRVKNGDLLVDVNLARTRLVDTPVGPFLPPDLGTLVTELAVRLRSHAGQPHLSGDISVAAPEANDTTVMLGFSSTEEGGFDTRVGVMIRDRVILDGEVIMPPMGPVLNNPEAIGTLLEDERLRADFYSADLTSAEMWDISQALGAATTNLVPDGRSMLHMNLQGHPTGPQANLVFRVRNQKEGQQRGRVVRNIADDLRLIAHIDSDETRLTLRAMQQRELLPSITLQASTPVGFDALFGDVDLGKAPITGHLVGDSFRLDGLIASAGSTLGGTRATLRGDVAVGGTLEAPTLVGSLETWFESLNVESVGFHQDELNLLWLFEGRKVSLVPIALEEDLEGSDKEPGTFALGFGMTFPSLDPAAMGLTGDLDMKTFRLLSRGGYDVTLSSDIKIRGTVDHPRITGPLTVDRARVAPALGGRDVATLGLPESVTLVTGEPVPPATTTERLSGFETGAFIDLTITLPPKSTKITVAVGDGADGAEIWAEGKVRARTEAGRLTLRGTVRLPKGHVSVYRKLFELRDDSRLVFTGDMSTDPQVSLAATYNIRDADLSSIGLSVSSESYIMVTVGGNMEAFDLTLTSDPGMDETNIISVLMTNRPSGSGDDSSNMAQSAVTGMVLGMALGNLTQAVTDKLPVDTFYVDAKDGDLSQSRLTVGKELFHNFSVRGRANMGQVEADESTYEVDAAYRIKQWTLSGRYGDIGEFGFEVNYRFTD